MTAVESSRGPRWMGLRDIRSLADAQHGGLTDGPIRPGESSIAPSWLDTSPWGEPEDTPPVATEEPEPLRENGLTAEDVVDSFELRLIAKFCEAYYILGHDRSVSTYKHQVEKSGTDISRPFAEAIVDEVMSRCP